MTPAPPTASLWAKKKYVWPSAAMAGRRTPNSWCRTACANISTTASASAVNACSRNGWRGLNPTGVAFPILPTEIERMQRRELPDNWDAELPGFAADAKGLATRDSSGKVLNAIAAHYPWLIGGAADLSPSTKTRLTFEGAGDLEDETPGGRNMHFGIREHAMGAIVNGLALSKIRAVRLELPDLFRLYEAAHSARRLDGAPRHLCVHPRFDRCRRRRARRISRSSSWWRCAAFQA